MDGAEDYSWGGIWSAWLSRDLDVIWGGSCCHLQLATRNSGLRNVGPEMLVREKRSEDNGRAFITFEGVLWEGEDLEA